MINLSPKQNKVQQTNSILMNFHHSVNNRVEKLQNTLNTVMSQLTQSVVSPEANSSRRMMTTRQVNTLASNISRSDDGISINMIGGTPLYFSIKRAIDVVLVGTFLFLIFPMLVFVALLIKMDNSGTIFTKTKNLTSRRVRKDGETKWQVVPFDMYEFRVENLSNVGIAQFLKSTGLYQLPTLINVMQGDMSLIGSKSIGIEETESYEDWQLLSFASKPGVVGLSRISHERRWLAGDDTRQDIWYACNQSLSLDFGILFQSFVSSLLSMI